MAAASSFETSSLSFVLPGLKAYLIGMRPSLCACAEHRTASKSEKKPPTASSDGHESRRWREGASTRRDAEIARDDAGLVVVDDRHFRGPVVLVLEVDELRFFHLAVRRAFQREQIYIKNLVDLRFYIVIYLCGTDTVETHSRDA